MQLTLLAWMTHTHGFSGVGARGAAQPAAEGFVIFTLVTLFFTLSCCACWMWTIWRRGVRPPEHIRLIMELAEEEEQEKARAAAAPRRQQENQPWQRDADWWRKSDTGGPAQT